MCFCSPSHLEFKIGRGNLFSSLSVYTGQEMFAAFCVSFSLLLGTKCHKFSALKHSTVTLLSPRSYKSKRGLTELTSRRQQACGLFWGCGRESLLLPFGSYKIARGPTFILKVSRHGQPVPVSHHSDFCFWHICFSDSDCLFYLSFHLRF